MRRFFLTTLFLSLGLLLAGYGRTAHAQETNPTAPVPPLTIFTEFPSEVVGIGENVTVVLKLDTGTTGQIVHLAVQDLLEGWSADFKGGNRLINSVYVRPDAESTVDLKVALPAEVEAGKYSFKVMATGDKTEASLPIEMIVQQKLPPGLSLNVDLPTLRGKPDGTFRYSATLKNEGDEDLNVDLLAEAPSGFSVTFKSGGQEVTTLPLDANSSKSLSIEASPLFKMPADSYPMTIHAQAGTAAADMTLIAEVVGQSQVNLTTPDGRLSGDVQAGKETAVNLLLQNSGSAAAEAITMSASPPSGWTVTFVPKDIPELSPGSQVEVVANVQPADNAIAGDYVLSFKAQPKDSTIESVDYRATVRTSTLWGIGGVVLIALAVGVVGLAVTRFGRR